MFFTFNLINKTTLLHVSHSTCNMLRCQSILATKLVYNDYGDPVTVLQKVKDDVPEVKSDEVLIKMIAAPVNPADVLTIRGMYPSRPPLPAVPGNEGVGEILELGDDVKDFAVGDRVVPLTNALGTWRSHLVLSSKVLLKVPKDLDVVGAATLNVNPCTAYRMLKDFVQLNEGDVVIQNGANSSCGQYVIQLAQAWKLRTVNIIRDRPNLSELVNYLKGLGATEVLTEEQLRTTDLFKSQKLPKPKLGLNCVGGENALEMMRHLANSSPIVTYGGMSGKPVTVPMSALIFRDIRVLGYWMTEWTKRNYDSEERKNMFKNIISLMQQNKLQEPPYQMVPFDQYREALTNTMAKGGMIGKKFVLDFN